jgi:hypothetical protein
MDAWARRRSKSREGVSGGREERGGGRTGIVDDSQVLGLFLPLLEALLVRVALVRPFLELHEGFLGLGRRRDGSWLAEELDGEGDDDDEDEDSTCADESEVVTVLLGSPVVLETRVDCTTSSVPI